MSRSRRRWMWLAVGLLAVVPLLTVDPAMVALLLDPELLAAIGGAGVLLARADLRAVVRRALVSLPVLWVRVGLRLSVRKPATLLA